MRRLPSPRRPDHGHRQAPGACPECGRLRRAATVRARGRRRSSPTPTWPRAPAPPATTATQATGKPAGHVANHRVVRHVPPHDGLEAATFSHAGVAPGTCATCHNGTHARPARRRRHVPTTAACDTLPPHDARGRRRPSTTPASRPAPARPATTARRATGKPATHVPTTRRVRHLPPHDRLDARDLQPHRRRARHLRDLPQRHARRRARPPTHVPTTAACDTCHRTTAWTPATFSHTGVAPGTCATCHNGTTATGKPPTPRADDAPRATPATARPPGRRRPSATPASRPAPAPPATTARPRPASRRRTSRRRPRATPATAPPPGRPATFSHTGVAPGTCATCHNGSTATGKTRDPRADHARPATPAIAPRPGRRRRSATPASRPAPARPATTAPPRPARPRRTCRRRASCDTCHRTTAWTPATFSHTGVAPGTCATCHNGTHRERQARDPRADHGLVRHLPSHDRLDAGDLQPHRRGARHLRDLPQRHDRDRQAATHVPTTRIVRHLPPHDGLEARRPSATPASRPAPARPATTAPPRPASRDPPPDHGLLRHLPPHDRLDAGDLQPHRRGARAPAPPATTARPRRARAPRHFVTTRSCDACHRTTGWTPGDDVLAPLAVLQAARRGVTLRVCHKTEQRGDRLAVPRVQARLRRLPCGRLQARRAQEGRYARGSSTRRPSCSDCSGVLPHVHERDAHHDPAEPHRRASLDVRDPSSAKENALLVPQTAPSTRALRFLALLAVLLAAPAALAQMIETIEVVRRDDQAVIQARFATTVRYVRHAPSRARQAPPGGDRGHGNARRLARDPAPDAGAIRRRRSFRRSCSRSIPGRTGSPSNSARWSPSGSAAEATAAPSRFACRSATRRRRAPGVPPWRASRPPKPARPPAPAPGTGPPAPRDAAGPRRRDRRRTSRPRPRAPSRPRRLRFEEGPRRGDRSAQPRARAAAQPRLAGGPGAHRHRRASRTASPTRRASNTSSISSSTPTPRVRIA